MKYPRAQRKPAMAVVKGSYLRSANFSCRPFEPKLSYQPSVTGAFGPRTHERFYPWDADRRQPLS